MAAMIFGAFGGAIFAPQPAGAVSKEMIQLQQQVQQLLQGQQDMRSAMDANNAAVKTLIQQSLDNTNQLNSKMGVLEQTVQQVQANTGTRIDTMTQQSQGVSDNLQDMQARVAKLAQQLTDIQNTLQSIDAKVSNSAPATTSSGTSPTSMAPPTGSPDPGATTVPTSAGHAMPPISADTLYQNALRDYTTGKYDMSRQEFSDYVKNFPTDDLAGNAQFYLGEIAYAQSNYPDAISQYEIVLANYPKSFKLEASLLKKGMAEVQLGKKQAGIKDLQQVVKRFPGSDESKRAQAKLHDLGAPIHPAAAH